MRPQRGFSLVELLLIILIVGTLTSLMGPPLSRIREAAALDGGRAQVTAALSLARASSARWGQIAVVHIDAEQDLMRVVIDTAYSDGQADSLIVRQFLIGDGGNVDLESNRSALCFNARGVTTTTGSCSETDGLITLSRAGTIDSVRINSAGRVW